ncbi:MAG: HD domain-containing protein [Pseudobutyrivibrio sp.]|nr:HD domain-containing protein [Pseudobutyrivibrio sp.]
MLEFTTLMEESVRNISPEMAMIIDSEEFKSLELQRRHFTSNTYAHSIRVAFMAGILAEKWGIHKEETVKAALLHDFCDRDTKTIDVEKQKGFYLFSHPIAAAINGDYYFGLTPRQKAAIIAHMFPGSLVMPASKMAWAIITADKLAACYETFILPAALKKAAVRI